MIFFSLAQNLLIKNVLMFSVWIKFNFALHAYSIDISIDVHYCIPNVQLVCFTCICRFIRIWWLIRMDILNSLVCSLYRNTQCININGDVLPFSVSIDYLKFKNVKQVYLRDTSHKWTQLAIIIVLKWYWSFIDLGLLCTLQSLKI